MYPDAPAFPTENDGYATTRTGDLKRLSSLGMTGAPGMTARVYAAIQLRVPDSGVEWLDQMILDSRRYDILTESVGGIISNNGELARIFGAAKDVVSRGDEPADSIQDVAARFVAERARRYVNAVIK